MGINIGTQQFHLPRRGRPTPPFLGEIGIIVPELENIKKRLDHLSNAGTFEKTPYKIEFCDSKTLLMTSPFGIVLRLHVAGSIPSLLPLGIAYIDIPIQIGKAPRLKEFFSKIFDAPAILCDLNGENSLLVTFGPHQYVRFRERKLQDYNLASHHIAYFVTNYNTVRDLIIKQGSILGDGAGQVFFFDELFDPDTGETILKFQQEVRSIYHRDFMRPLINRWPIISEPFSDQRDFMKTLEDVPGLKYGEE